MRWALGPAEAMRASMTVFALPGQGLLKLVDLCVSDFYRTHDVVAGPWKNDLDSSVAVTAFISRALH